MSSWYVWAALGLYPLTPGSANLVVGSPMFSSASVNLGNGKRLEIEATGAPDVYVRSATVVTASGSATPLTRAWIPSAIVRDGGTIHFVLGPKPDKRWGASGICSTLVQRIRNAFRRIHGAERCDPGFPERTWLGNRRDRVNASHTERGVLDGFYF